MNFFWIRVVIWQGHCANCNLSSSVTFFLKMFLFVMNCHWKCHVPGDQPSSCCHSSPSYYHWRGCWSLAQKRFGGGCSGDRQVLSHMFLLFAFKQKHMCRTQSSRLWRWALGSMDSLLLATWHMRNRKRIGQGKEKFWFWIFKEAVTLIFVAGTRFLTPQAMERNAQEQG